HAEDFTFVVVVDTALRHAIGRISIEPCVETRLFRRLRAMCRTVLQSSNRGGKSLEVSFFIQQTSAHQYELRHGIRHALTEPQRARVVLPGVIDRLKRLRANSLHVPQMKEFVGAY